MYRRTYFQTRFIRLPGLNFSWKRRNINLVQQQMTSNLHNSVVETPIRNYWRCWYLTPGNLCTHQLIVIIFGHRLFVYNCLICYIWCFNWLMKVCSLFWFGSIINSKSSWCIKLGASDTTHYKIKFRTTKISKWIRTKLPFESIFKRITQYDQ